MIIVHYFRLRYICHMLQSTLLYGSVGLVSSLFFSFTTVGSVKKGLPDGIFFKEKYSEKRYFVFQKGYTIQKYSTFLFKNITLF